MDYVSDINGKALLEISAWSESFIHYTKTTLEGTSISLLLQFHSYNISAHNP